MKAQELINMVNDQLNQAHREITNFTAYRLGQVAQTINQAIVSLDQNKENPNGG